MSKFIPNSYQTPNLYADQYMAFLTPNEWKVLCYAIRRIFGFQKLSDRISISQFCNGVKTKEGETLDYGTGLGSGAVSTATKSLVKFGLLIIISNYDKKRNLPPEYSLQLDSEKVKMNLIMDRYDKKKNSDKERAANARKGLQDNLSYPIDKDTPTLSDKEGLSYPIDEAYPMDKANNNQKKTSRKQEFPSQAKNSLTFDPFPGLEETSKPTQKAKNGYYATAERLERAFAEARGCAAPVWPSDGDGKSKSEQQKIAKGLMKTWRNPLMKEIYEPCKKDVSLAEKAIKEVVKKMMDDNLTFSKPCQIIETFNSWIIDANNHNGSNGNGKTLPVVVAPETDNRKTLAELQAGV